MATLAFAQESKPLQPDEAIVCTYCDAWNKSREPFRVFGNTYFVGVAGLSAVLITSDDGHILLDGALPQSAPLIDENVRTLGFRTQDVRLIATSHEHFDHIGGVAALQRASGAVAAASSAAARALRRGEPNADDPQYAYGDGYPSVQEVRGVEDGEVLQVGELEVKAHYTPGHTPGSTTWTWRSCEGERCLNIVYADSLTAVSAPGFVYTEQRGLVESFRESISKVANLPCDILLSVHPGFSDLDEKLRLRGEGASPDPFIDITGCRAYAQAATQTLDKRLAEER